MVGDEEPSINTRLYGAMGEDIPTTIVGGRRRTIVVRVCVSGDVCPVLKKVYTNNNKNVSKIKIKYYV